jgi:hypothetical protein
MGTIVGVIVTFPAVVLAWVFFRSPNLHTALDIISSMVGLNGITLPGRSLFKWGLADEIEKLGIHFGASTLFYGNESIWTWIAILWTIAWFSPNSQQILSANQPTLEHDFTRIKFTWKPNKAWLSIVAITLLYSVIRMEKVSEFLYFQF